MSVIYDAMMFARKAHEGQKRKYSNEPYFAHLAEVAGIVASVEQYKTQCKAWYNVVATAWLHDTVEDCGVSVSTISSIFGFNIGVGVMMLSDLEEGNRETRKRLSRERLASAEGWMQTIKLADLISNTASILTHDEKFAKVYLEEKRLLLEVMTKGDERLYAIAKQQVEEGLKQLRGENGELRRIP